MKKHIKEWDCSKNSYGFERVGWIIECCVLFGPTVKFKAAGFAWRCRPIYAKTILDQVMISPIGFQYFIWKIIGRWHVDIIITSQLLKYKK